MKGTTLHHDNEFAISFEDINGSAMCHCEIFKTSKSVLKRCRAMIDALQRTHARDAYGVSEMDDHKHHKFLKLMGFVPFRNKWIIDNGQDKIVKVWVRYYDQHR